MSKQNGDNYNGDIRQFTNKLGVILEDVLQHFKVIFFRGFTFLPDMAMHFGSFIVTDDFIRITGKSDISDGIGFIFHNIFEDLSHEGTDKCQINNPMEPPYVRIFPYAISQTLQFKKATHVSHVSISISAAYLKNFLNEDAEHFAYLFDSANNF